MTTKVQKQHPFWAGVLATSFLTGAAAAFIIANTALLGGTSLSTATNGIGLVLTLFGLAAMSAWVQTAKGRVPEFLNRLRAAAALEAK